MRSSRCPKGARYRPRAVIAFVTDEKVVKSILEHLGLPTTGPPMTPARFAHAGEDALWQDDVPALQSQR